MIIHDSNGRDLNLPQLKPDANVKRETRYTIDEATQNIPQIDCPDNVSDIVFAVGFNDTRRGTSPKKIREYTLNMQIEYHKRFKNARQHLTAFIPLSDQQIEANLMLQRHAENTGCNFISMKGFRDKVTGGLRSNLINGIHLKEIGLRTFAKAIKKSLFSPSNLTNEAIASITRLSTDSV